MIAAWLTIFVLGSQTVVPIPQNPLPDTLNVVNDSLKTAIQDSLFYTADNAEYDYLDEKIFLFGSAGIRYQDSTIASDSLLLNLKKDQAFSFGKTVLKDGDQILIGREVYYDINTQMGMMSDGISKLDKGYYYGAEIRKVDKDIYDVDNGRFTTCDGVEPDFWFWAKQLRLFRGDKIVGKPVVMYVNHFPVFYFPYLTFPIKRGRHAGFLMPEPGYNSFDGKIIRNIAYYYPIADYADITAALDLMEKTGWRSSLSGQYLKRYAYSGSFDMTYQQRYQGELSNNDYAIRATHHHELADKAAFDVNIDYVSSKRIWEGSDNVNESLAQQVTSTLSYRKPIGSSFFNVGSTYTQDLQNDRVNVTLPSASYRLASRPLYEFFWNSDDVSKDNWWTNIGSNYNIQLTHSGLISEKDFSFGDIIWDNSSDPTDTTGIAMLNQHNIGIRHNGGLSYSWKMLGWLNLAHGISYQEAWFDRDKDGKKWVRGNHYSLNSSANFNIYGIRNFQTSRIKSIRHLINPSLSFSYAPDFSENSRFYSFGGIGVPSGKRSRNMNINLSQRWQLKYLEKDKKTERRISDLFSLSSGASVDFEKENKQLSNISHRFSFRPGDYNLGNLDIGPADFRLGSLKIGYNTDLSMTQDPHKISFADPYLRNYYFTQSLRFSGTAPYADYFPRAKNDLFNAYLPADSLSQKAEELADQSGSDDAWSLGIAHDLSAPKNLFDSNRSNLRLDASLRITANWSLRYANYYDLKKSELLSQSIDISRTLHCWKIDISYTRRNEYWDYRIVFFNTSLPDALRLQTRDSKRY